MDTDKDSSMEMLIDMLVRHEGFRRFPYMCASGKVTIGVGRNLEDKGLSESEVFTLLRNDIAECVSDLETVFGFDAFIGLATSRRHALIDMRFNLGPGGFRSFRKMIAALKKGDFEEAAGEMLDSGWARQVGSRARDLAAMMEDGHGMNGAVD